MSVLGHAGEERFSQAQYEEVLGRLRQRKDDELAIYVHVPFCHVR